ncbi:hypothetical protein [Roseisolibacter sp. H3M3-2]|uniref:hypothetical protein n=1 Tax=Roseisolibacter sp. H3M3-2 TaxID=3031323 RepID=UPI0023DB747B|nr:hypothetical protein [Roseisolibacter sp. H3M3-2]MDF1502529.1 hypothetical protein [Roseisolibacter sp. H3M3-2]
MSPRLLSILAPILCLLTGAFALYQLWVAGIALRVQNWAFAAFYLVFGLAGLAVTTALWRLRRGLRPPR